MKKATSLPLNSIIFGVIFLFVYFGSIHPILKQSLTSSAKDAFVQPALHKAIEVEQPTLTQKEDLEAIEPKGYLTEKKEPLPLPNSSAAPVPEIKKHETTLVLGCVEKNTEHRNSVYLRYTRRPDSLSLMIAISGYELADNQRNYALKLAQKWGWAEPENTSPYINVFFFRSRKSSKWLKNRHIGFSDEFPSIDQLKKIKEQPDYEFDIQKLPEDILAINIENTHKRNTVDIKVMVHALWKDPSGSPQIFLSN